MQAAELGDSGRAADGCEISFIQVVEILARLALDAAPNVLGGGLSLLNRGRSHSGDRLACFVFDIGKVSDHKNFRMLGEAEVLRNLYASCTIGRSTENI